MLGPRSNHSGHSNGDKGEITARARCEQSRHLSASRTDGTNCRLFFGHGVIGSIDEMANEDRNGEGSTAALSCSLLV
jgi:hypothetical protein